MGAISGGANLIKSAEYRSIIKDLQGIQIAYKTFQERYHAIPGDFDGATGIWPVATCESTLDSCNGNGNGYIDGNFDATDETKAALKHLSLAGLIPNSIELIDLTTNSGMIIGTSAPESKIDAVGLFMAGGPTIDKNLVGDLTDVKNPFDGENAVFMGMQSSDNLDNLVTAAFSPSSSYAIDEKIDDGSTYGAYSTGAGTGKFRATEGNDITGGECKKDVSPGLIAYQVTFGSEKCVIGLQLD